MEIFIGAIIGFIVGFVGHKVFSSVRNEKERDWENFVAKHPTPLHAAAVWAVDQGDFKPLQKLIAAKVDPNDTGTDEDSPLVMIIKRFGGLDGKIKTRQERVVDMLLAAGADPNQPGYGGYTALHHTRMDADITSRLLAAGANPNAQSTKGDTVLGLHLGSWQIEALQVLLQGRADPNLPVNARGETALMVADSADIISLLLDHKADPNAEDSAKTPVIVRLAQKRRDSNTVPILKALLAAGANPNAVDSKGVTALMAATEGNDTEVMGLLLAAGANREAVDIDGRTALSIAQGNLEVAIENLSQTATVNLLTAG